MKKSVLIKIFYKKFVKMENNEKKFQKVSETW